MWHGNVRGLVKKVVLGCKARMCEQLKLFRSNSAHFVRVYVEKLVNYVQHSGEKVAKKIEPTKYNGKN